MLMQRTSTDARATLADAHAARAEYSRHGAGQLSLSAQRAPTTQDCDEGWGRVEAIVEVAEASAREAARLAAELEQDAPRSAIARSARVAALKAESAARDARRIVDERNDAHTFHTTAGFSFGEGWHVAAAAVLAGVAVQIEPGQRPGTAQAERFLCDAGLGGQIQAYRSRPRAMKQTTALVASAFRADPVAAQRRLRAAFLGDAPTAPSVVEWAEPRLAGSRDQQKVLLWVRRGAHDAHRNTPSTELAELARRALAVGLLPIVLGDAMPEGCRLDGALDMTLFWTDPCFRGIDARRAQIQLFEHLARCHGLVGQLGVTTAGMDGPALMGLPTMYLTDEPNVRMRRWDGVVPGYREIMRDVGYLERIEQALRGWRRAHHVTGGNPPGAGPPRAR